MTLQELGKQYLEQEAVLRRRLSQLREQPHDPEDRIYERRMYYLQCEATDCKKIGLYLLHYYDKGESR